MAENDNRNNLENSVRSMISDSIAKLREESAKKTEALKNDIKTEKKAEEKTSDKVYSEKTAVSKSEDKTGNEGKISHSETDDALRSNKPQGKTSDPANTEEEIKKAAEEEAKKLKEVQKEEERKKKEALKEEQAKIKEADAE